jgi:hypothetical protein
MAGAKRLGATHVEQHEAGLPRLKCSMHVPAVGLVGKQALEVRQAVGRLGGGNVGYGSFVTG